MAGAGDLRARCQRRGGGEDAFADDGVLADELSLLRCEGLRFLEDGFRDRFWPKTVISFLVLATILTTASIQFVSPTRKWRPSLPGPVRRLVRRRSA